MNDDLIRRSDAIELCRKWRDKAHEAKDQDGWWTADNLLRHTKEIPSADAVSEWIPCEDRLPSKSGDYLVTYEWVGQSGTKYTEIEVIDFERGRWSDHTRHYEKVTAWMPLPKLYGGQNNE